eukprot:82492-Amphidinium_carterae.1
MAPNPIPATEDSEVCVSYVPSLVRPQALVANLSVECRCSLLSEFTNCLPTAVLEVLLITVRLGKGTLDTSPRKPSQRQLGNNCQSTPKLKWVA